jgi:hypothetical protein
VRLLRGGEPVPGVCRPGSLPARGPARRLVVRFRLDWDGARRSARPLPEARPDEAELAAHYKPNLYFDTSEKWRPLSVASLFAESDGSDPSHRQCLPVDDPAFIVGVTVPPIMAPGTEDDWAFNHENVITAYCPQRSDPSALLRSGWNSPNSYLDLNGYGSQDDDDYRSPDPACTVGGLYECNGGAAATLYHYVSQPLAETEYRYVGYWAFYRHNSFQEIGLDHGGDWEGVAVAPSHEKPGTFDFASFSSHNGWFSYLRDTLECDDPPSGNSCGTETDKAFSHLKVYVANGSHANYPRRCAATTIPPNVCPQANGLPEQGYDGSRSWGHNSYARGPHPSGLTAFPGLGAGNWVEWQGRWGHDDAPTSPAQQATFFNPWGDCGFGEEDCPRPGASVAASLRPRQLARRPLRSPTSCQRWFGPLIVAVACDRTALRRSLRRGALGRSGNLSLRVRRRAGRAAAASRTIHGAASARPLAQALGQPLAAGDVLVIRGRASRGTELRVRFTRGRSVYEARFSRLRLGRRGRATVRVRRTRGDRRPTLTLKTRGRDMVVPTSQKRVRG